MTEPEDYEGPAPEPMLQERRGWLSNSPWWLVSAGMHLVLLLGATLVAIEQSHVFDPEGSIVIVSAAQGPKIVPPEPENVKVDHRGPPTDSQEDAKSNLPDIFFPDAKISDHYESADGEDTHEMKGDSFDFLSYIKGEAGGFRGRQVGKTPGVYDTMGVGIGGGGGGRYGGRKGGRENLRPPGGGKVGRGSEDAVLAALKWLAHHQGGDGGWGAESYVKQCSGGSCTGHGDSAFDTGVTGLAVLAFLGAGYTPLSKESFPDPVDPSRTLHFADTVKRGIRWLIDHQDPEGCVGERGTKYMYNHAVAALTLSEAYGMTASAPIREPAQKAIDFLVAAQNPGKAWRYSAKCGDNDSSVSGWAVMALKSAEISELHVPKTAFDGAINWLNEATSKDGGYYRVGYNAPNTGKVYVPGKNEQWDDHPALSAVGVMSRIFILKNRKDPALTAIQLVAADAPEWKQYKIDYYYWYYAALALFQYDSAKGPMWKKWSDAMLGALVPNQRGAKSGCAVGSWDPEVDRWGFEGGRPYAVAINALTLEVFYRYSNVFGGTPSAAKE